jgi:hydrogenase nickel incorporation protein HypA/HybF
MHELQVTEQILSVALQHTEGRNVERITAIHLRIGELSDLEGIWIQKYFDHLSEGTLAENAKLVIEKVPIVLECGNCGGMVETNRRDMDEAICPQCEEEKPRFRLFSGREYMVTNLEVM